MILVTGAAGFIGTHLVRALLTQGHDVTAVVHTHTLPSDLSDRVHTIHADLADASSLSLLPHSVDAVFHLAILSPREEAPDDATQCIRVNTLGTANILEYCRTRQVRRLIYSSSIAVYGAPDSLPVSEQAPLRPDSFYAVSKVAAENLCQRYHKAYGLSIACLRYASVYGPGQRPHTVLPLFLQRAASGEPLILFGAGERTQDFVYVKDVVAANLLALSAESCDIFNIGSGVGTRMEQLAQTVAQVVGADAASITYDTSRTDDGIHFQLDIAKARRELGYHPQYTLQEGLEEYCMARGSA